MLRQRYNTGYWDLDAQGNRFFSSSDEVAQQNALRYVFFDGRNFIIITGWRESEKWIDRVAQSVRLIP
jgi:hypothetical protein